MARRLECVACRPAIKRGARARSERRWEEAGHRWHEVQLKGAARQSAVCDQCGHAIRAGEACVAVHHQHDVDADDEAWMPEMVEPVEGPAWNALVRLTTEQRGGA